ncbi:MAG: hypothetical protein ACPGLV_00335 [Bacteroidia bacterium]
MILKFYRSTFFDLGRNDDSTPHDDGKTLFLTIKLYYSAVLTFAKGFGANIKAVAY